MSSYKHISIIFISLLFFPLQVYSADGLNPEALRSDGTIPLTNAEANFDDETSTHNLKYINVHSHLLEQDDHIFGPSAEYAISVMNGLGIKTTLIMPPPQILGQDLAYTADKLKEIVENTPQRFQFLGGGGSLNPLIFKAAKEGKIEDKIKDKFEKNANILLKMGVRGFGEMAALQFALNGQPYIEAAPDNPLFLFLSDMAAKAGVPIDLHMEAVVKPFKLPENLSGQNTPETIQPNIEAFERLLSYNEETPIIWEHLGWDNTGDRTPELCRRLMEKHKNLYMALRVFPTPANETSVEENRLLDDNGDLRYDWLDLFESFPDRFLIGGDEFFKPLKPSEANFRQSNTELTVKMLAQLSEDLANQIAIENPKRLFKLK